MFMPIFLDEAAQILSKDTLNEVASLYRAAGAAWNGLLLSLLPEDVPTLRETRQAIDSKTELFIEQGAVQLETIIECNNRLDTLKTAAVKDFPMSEAEISDLCDEICQQIQNVLETETVAVSALKAAIA